MTQSPNTTEQKQAEAARPAPALHVAPGPHLSDTALTTRGMMLDVLFALVPVAAVAIIVFQWYAVAQIFLCVGGCVAAEAIFTAMRRKPLTIRDGSAVVTGAILAFSLPATCPWWVSVIASFMAIGIGKIVFGGVGMNIFNPAMVGRAFVMISFAGLLAAGGYTDPNATVDVVTQATPMTSAFKQGHVPDGLLMKLLLGDVNGSLGETSSLALILGGLYLCVRRTASWEIPAGALVGLVAVAGLDNFVHPGNDWTVLHHVLGGAFLLGAFFIVTDPVTSPLTPKGKFRFGVLFGLLVMLIRLFTTYPEGVMFSVLLVNAAVPLINRWTVPRPVGGPVPQKT